MNKRIVVALIAAALTGAMMFASGASEEDLVFNAANRQADAASMYVAGTHQLELQAPDAGGSMVTRASQKIEVSKSTSNGWYFDLNSQGSDVISLVSEVYDGFTFTPFDDGVSKLDCKAAGQETVDGKLCNVIEIECSLDKALLSYKAHYSESGEIIGYDSDDDDFDGTVTAAAYVDARTSQLARLVLRWELGGKSIVQTNSYVTFDGVSVASEITFDVTVREAKGGVTCFSGFRIIDRLSDYQKVSQFTRTRS